MLKSLLLLNYLILFVFKDDSVQDEITAQQKIIEMIGKRINEC